MSDITVDVLIIICGIVIAIAIVSAAFMKLRTAERRMHESSYKLKAYTDLLNAVTEINLAYGDSYKMDIAKKDLAITLNRLNLIASSGVLRSVNDLLDLFNESKDKEFDSDTTELVLGPIHKQRWIYSCVKQLLDRIIYAYGQQGLQFTLFRPFNWIGSGLDSMDDPKEGSSRVLTQFLGHIVRGEPIKLVDGGQQTRAFTYIDDAVECLTKVIDNPGGIADGKIYNIGNPYNSYSIRKLAEMMLEIALSRPEYAPTARNTKLVDISALDSLAELEIPVVALITLIHGSPSGSLIVYRQPPRKH